MDAVDRSQEAFASELEALKRRGCFLLVVGPGAGTTRCHDLLGDDDRDRTRLVVDTRRGPDPTPGGDSSVVRAGVDDVRSASAATPSTGDTPAPEPPDLDAVADELVGRIDRLDAAGLDAGELRVCLGDLGALDSDRSGDLLAFLRVVTKRVRGANGMGHAHLTDTSPLRATVNPVFDVTVEIRPVPTGRQQRWLLHEAGLDSGWIAVEGET